MHKEHRQQHLKSNNIISKLAVIVLSIVLLTGISLVPALQIGVNGQVQQQPQQQKQVGLSQVIKQIAQQVANANPGTNATHVQQVLVQLAKQTAQTASKEQAIQEIRQISSQVSAYPFGTVSQSLSHFAQQVESGNSNVVQIVQQTVQEKASSGGGSKNITQSLSNTAVQQASGGSKNVNQVIRQAAQILANRAGVPVEKVEAVIIQMALQIAQAQGKSITGQSILQIANQITQNPNGVLAQAILKLVREDDGGKSSKTTTIIKNVVKVSGGGGGGKGNCRDNIFIGNLICNVGRIIIKPQPNPPIEPPEEEEEIRKCPQDASFAQFTCETGKSREQLCSERPEIPGCEPPEPPKELPPIAEPIEPLIEPPEDPTAEPEILPINPPEEDDDSDSEEEGDTADEEEGAASDDSEEDGGDDDGDGGGDGDDGGGDGGNGGEAEG
jgi:hypothetical protein